MGQHFTRMLNQQTQQAIFRRGEFNQFTVDCNETPGQINLKPARGENRVLLLRFLPSFDLSTQFCRCTITPATRSSQFI